MLRWKPIQLFLIGLLALLVSVMPVGSVWAAPATDTTPGQGLEISPPVVELRVDPGQTVTTAISVRNVTKATLVVKGRSDDFGAGDDESGQPRLLLEETGANRYSMKYWVNRVPDLTLAPGELKKTQVSITVPQNAEPGGHFGVIRFTAMPPELEGTGVALSASVGTLVLMRVSGTITDQLAVEEFTSGVKAAKDAVYTKRGFFEYGPIDFVVRLKNEGSVHEKPKGKIVVKDSFGKEVSSIDVNTLGGNVLPGSIRRFEQRLDKKQLIGRYEAKLSMTYASDKKIDKTIVFWVIPWRIILLSIIGLIALVWVLRLGIKRYNQHIINQARRR